MRKDDRSRVVVAAVAVWLASAGHAATLVVNAQGTGDYATPQEAINAAWDGDVVQLEPGTYGLESAIDLLGKRITLRGGDGSDAGAVVLTSSVAGGMAITCVNGETAAAHITCLTITNLQGLQAAAPWGGILVQHASPTITNVVVSNSTVPKDGGGITLINSDSRLHNVVVSACRAATWVANSPEFPTYGGGVYVSGGSPTLTSCTLQLCEASYGGNLYAVDADITIRDSTIASAGPYGRWGAGAFFENCSADLERVHVLKNHLTCVPPGYTEASLHVGGGCGLAFHRGAAKLTDCVIRDNSSSTDSDAEFANESIIKGGGVYAKGCRLLLESCAVTNNFCGDRDLQRKSAIGSLGGGICVQGHASDQTSVVIAGGRVNLNQATGLGGGLYVDPGDSVSPDTVPRIRMHGAMVASNHAAWDWGWHWNQDVGSYAFVNTVIPLLDLIEDHTGNFSQWFDPEDIRQLYYDQWTSKGGGMYIEGGDVECWHTTFFENYADMSGGGLYINQTADRVLLHDCHMVQCSATNNGPGVAMAGSAHVSFDDHSSLVGCRFQSVPRVDLNWDASQFGLFSGDSATECTVALQDTYVCVGYVDCPTAIDFALYDVTMPLEMLPFYHYDLDCAPVGFLYTVQYEDLGGNSVNMEGCSAPDSDGDGTPDPLDRCPGAPETDSDLDGVPDCKDQCPGMVDADFDEDGILDCHDQCPGEPDIDSDGDGVMDCKDQCPGIPDTDSDGDGVADCHDQCPGTADVDSDGDGALDCVDPCPQIPYDCDGDPSTLELAPGMSIQGAIDTAPHGATLAFAAGRYDAQRVYLAGRTLHFAGTKDGHGKPATVFDGGGQPMFSLEGGPLTDGTSFADIVWTDGACDWGDGLWGSAVTMNSGPDNPGKVSFANCTFTNQTPILQAGLSGIIRVQSNDCDLTGCNFTGNGTDQFACGPPVSTQWCQLTIHASTFAANTLNTPAVASAWGGSTHMLACTVEDNLLAGGPVAVYQGDIDGESKLDVLVSSFTGNHNAYGTEYPLFSVADPVFVTLNQNHICDNELSEILLGGQLEQSIDNCHDDGCADDDGDGLRNCDDPYPEWPGRASADRLQMYATPAAGSIQGAFDVAVDGATIHVSGGTYYEHSLNMGGKQLSLVGQGAQSFPRAIIDAGGAGPVMWFASGEGPEVIVDAVTLQNGDASSNGGGIEITGGSAPTIRDSTIRNCNAGMRGGGISITAASPHLQDLIIVNNTAGLDGGGIAVMSSAEGPLIEGVSLHANNAQRGGGIVVMDGSTVSMPACNLIGNSAFDGGGLQVSTGGVVNVTGGLIARNTASARGAAVNMYEGQTSLYINGLPDGTQVAIRENHSAAFGAINGFGDASVWLAGVGFCANTNDFGSPNVDITTEMPWATSGVPSICMSAECADEDADQTLDDCCDSGPADSDTDGVLDCYDQCPGGADVDTDGDGTMDCVDLCPNDPEKVAPGVCGCGVPDTDTDGDGVPDCNDPCPAYAYDCDDDPTTLELVPGMAIQSAIELVPEGGTIELAAGTYHAVDVDLSGKAITLRGTIGGDGAPTSVLDAMGEGTVLLLVSGEPAATIVQDVVITGGAASMGAGMRVENGAAPTLQNCLFESNHAAAEGGGLRIVDASPTILSCAFTNNTAQLNGGGCIVRGGLQPVIFSDCTFAKNFAGTSTVGAVGGGCSVFDAVVTFGGSMFESNGSSTSGGGLFIESQQAATEVTLEQTSLRGNAADTTGSGAQLQGDAASLWLVGDADGGQAMWVDGNTSQAGGAVNATGQAMLSVGGTTFCGNTEGGSGLVSHVTSGSSVVYEGGNCFAISCADANGDGQPEGCCPEDWDAVIPSCAQPCGADLDGNGSVDIDDLLSLLSAFGQTCPNGCAADLTGDGEVDINDLLTLLSAFGPCV